MKKTLHRLLLLLVCFLSAHTIFAQTGTIVTYSTISACNIAVDRHGYLYTANGSHIYKIDSGSTETSVVGGGSSYGDGGAATSAKLNNTYNLAFDAIGNMYIADAGDAVIRKVDTFGIITTVAGNKTLGTGYTGDGGAATSAKLSPTHVCVDIFGNIFIADQIHSVIRKVNTSGIISTYAGNGTSGYSGDGGAATSAQLDNSSGVNMWGITTDMAGNLYISQGSRYRVRKVDTFGIITTFAGDGFAGDTVGIDAVRCNVYYPQGLLADSWGNLFIAEWQNCVLGVVTSDGILNTVAGNYTISFSGDGGPATSAGLNAVSDVAIDNKGNIYIADCHNGRVRKVTGSYFSLTNSADSFGVYLNNKCNTVQLNIVTRTYNPSYSLKCFFGDGTSTTISTVKGSFGGGVGSFTHNYNLPGTYTIKTLLMNGSTVIDSLTYVNTYKLCNTFSLQYYYDANNNCVFDASDSHLSLPMLTEVDSNGKVVDTISSTGGIYYTAYGLPGDVYTFKAIVYPGNLTASCPASGIITDTIKVSSYNTHAKAIALKCSSGSGFDLSAQAIIPVTGVRDQWGNIYVNNAYCAPTDATVTLHYSKHYKADMGSGHIDATPAPLSFTDSTITWRVTGLNASATKPANLYYAIWVNPDSGMVVGYPAHTYITVNPTTGDNDTTNNFVHEIDTVRGGCDPNEMAVIPTGNILSGTTLTYEIEFTNTGNDTTYNVYVMDTLSDNVDINSFRLLLAPENMNILKLKTGVHNILKFDFPNINLLDSLHHPQDCSKGLIFTVKTRTGLPDGTKIFNHAGIFFDYNPVVLTNTVENTIGKPDNVALLTADNFKLFPNPASSAITVISKNNLETISISNHIGQVIFSQNGIHSNNLLINVKDYPTGVYFIRINGVYTQKFLKE